MSPEDSFALFALMMGGGSIFIALTMMVQKMHARTLAFKERAMELTASTTAEKAAQYAAHTERLEARVRVLERIATDKGADLASQIEDLRDPALN